MADYTGGASSAALQNQDVSNSLAHQQTAAILNAMRQMAMQQEMRQQQARGPAMEQLAGLFGGAGAAPRAPMVPPPPGTLAGGPQPPPPGTGSVPMGMPPAGAAGAVPPPPMAGGGIPKPAGPPPIQPFRPLPPSGDSPTNMPNIPQPGAGGGGGIPPPPAEAPPAAAAPATGPPGIGQAKLREAIASVSKLPMTSAQKMDVLDQMMPVLNKAEQQELSFYKAQTAAMTLTEKYYRDALKDSWERERQGTRERREDNRDRETTRREEADRARDEQRTRTNDLKERQLHAALAKIAGGADALKGVEYIYPKDKDGRPDQSQAPLGTRGVTKTGKIVYMNADGQQTQASALAGGTAKEAKATGSDGGFSGRNGEIMAALAERGAALPAGFRAKSQQLGLLNAISSRHPDLTPDQIAEKIKTGQLDLKGLTKEVQVAGAQAGKIAYAEQEIEQTIPLVREASAKLPRGSFVPYEKLKQMGEDRFSDPDLAEFKMYMTSLSNAYDMLAARGGTDMEKRKENRKNFDTAKSPEALERILQAVRKEAQASGRAAKASMDVTHRDAPSAPSGAKKISSDADYAALPSGATFIAPDGTTRKKP